MIEFLLSKTGIFLTIAGYLLYKLLTWNNDFFEKRNVNFLKPVPLFGNLFTVIFQRESFFNWLQRMYYAFPGSRLV
jgi:hypothetical protein